MNELLNLKKIGEGQDSEVYSLENGKVLKLFRKSNAGKMAIREIEILKTICKTGINIPKVYEYVCISDRPGFIMEEVEGDSILSINEKKPYLMVKMSKVFAKSHAEIHKFEAPNEIPLLKEEMKKCIKSVKCLEKEIIEYTLNLLNELPYGNNICHGDYNPANVIYDSVNPVFLDWSGVSKGDATADVAHTLLIVKNGQFPPNTSMILKFIFKIGRKTFANIYFHTYQKYNQLDLSLLSKWEMIRAVGRLAYGGNDEKPALLKFINNFYKNRDQGEVILF